jgi:hypothetical protein
MTGAGTMIHLTDEQLDDALIGDQSIELTAFVAEHLGVCPACRERLADARMSLESFRAVSLAWSERRSATMPASLQEQLLLKATGALRTWGSAAAAVLVIAVALPFAAQYVGSTGKTEPAQFAGRMAESGPGLGTVVNDEQLASDNQMLNEIDRELSPSGTASVSMDLQGGPEQTAAAVAERMVQD